MKTTTRLTNILLLLLIGIVVVVFACPEYCGEWSGKFDVAYKKTYLKYWNR